MDRAPLFPNRNIYRSLEGEYYIISTTIPPPLLFFLFPEDISSRISIVLYDSFKETKLIESISDTFFLISTLVYIYFFSIFVAIYEVPFLDLNAPMQTLETFLCLLISSSRSQYLKLKILSLQRNSMQVSRNLLQFSLYILKYFQKHVCQKNLILIILNL